MVGKNIDKLNKLPAGQMLDMIIDQAINNQASYIHIDPSDIDVLIRYRVNGSLIEIDRFPKKRLDSFLDRIKTLANLEPKVRNIPQDGKFKKTSENDIYTLHVSIIPTILGEKISINLINNSKIAPSLNELGYWGNGLKQLLNVLDKRNGLILLAGPRNSGKSLSLLSMLNNESLSGRNIATVEDPVEFIIDGATQIQVNNKTSLSFLSGVQALDKHDNDVIMASEIRDSETAKVLFDYASHGRLILSTIYTKHIYSAIDKLNDAGISHNIIAHTLKLISTQQLVRRLCSDCKTSIIPSPSDIYLINQILKVGGITSMKNLHEIEVSYTNEISPKGKSATSKDLNTTEGRIKKLWRAKSGGCENCLNTGYKGMLGLFEIITITPSIKKIILSLGSPELLMSKAYSEGSINLLVDGLVKSLQGQTSIDEVYRLYQDHF
jgi:type II secretory ATPase GspE/PulE/Tfp pilus assembly ATPase PilB-like protein